MKSIKRRNSWRCCSFGEGLLLALCMTCFDFARRRIFVSAFSQPRWKDGGFLGESAEDMRSAAKPSLSMRKAPLAMPGGARGPGENNELARQSLSRTYLRYPTLKDGPCTGIGKDDVRQVFHPMLANNTRHRSGDMDLVFLGTASCTPSVTRGVSCTALRLNWTRKPLFGVPGAPSGPGKGSAHGGTWLFDCGEGTQLQIQRTGSVKPGKVSKIFLTHSHGDHTFGLPGLLCLMGQDRSRHSPPVDIYGPEGLRMWLRVAIRYSVSRIVPNYRVHELKGIPFAPEWQFCSATGRLVYKGVCEANDGSRPWGALSVFEQDTDNWIAHAKLQSLKESRNFGEVPGGRDIDPTYSHECCSHGAPIWEVEDTGSAKVYAAPMSHTVPCVGYMVEEYDKPGRLRHEIVTPIVKRNLAALKEAGYNIPMKALAVLKDLSEGESFSFPDGTVVTHEDALESPRKGRKIVICGDTASSRAMQGLAQHADVVVHEATNTFLEGVDKDSDKDTTSQDTTKHGHSTPEVAGEFARLVSAKRLVLNHFSPRYKGDQSVESLTTMMRIEEQAMAASGLGSEQMAAAWDFMVLPVEHS